MNQELMVRLFRAIEGDASDDIVKIAHKIIDDEQQKGHAKLADKLKSILNANIAGHLNFRKELKTILPQGINIPTDKRNNVPLASTVERDHLRHEMVLPKEVETKIARIEKEFVARERLSHFGLKPRQKVLFYGAPGCGKSMSAERIAWNIGLPFLKVRFEAIISSYLGESASNLKKLFESIKNYPCVLLLDEFDFIAKSRSSVNEVGEMHRIVNILLNLLEDYEAPGILVATTNLEGAIDQALFRRFDDIIEIPKPGSEEIKRLLKKTLSAVEVSSDVNWDDVSNEMIGLSAALVVKTGKDAAKTAVIKGERVVDRHHITQALNENIQHK
ncbi:MAG: ATP-binding protein [Flammeovirgaceae bacterium]|jgi:SpoVK/Ycf46/Vps4 family AAA+-type ATPase|nr:ATP-binding protein [Flammeovirgaceae bacterium]